MGDEHPTRPPPPLGPVLVVDDDPKLRNGLARILRNEGHAVIEASSGACALDLMRAYELGFVILDYAMPGLDGGTVARAMRRELTDAPPAVLLTAGRHQQSEAERMGIPGLSKPFRVEELLATVALHRPACD